MTGFCAVAELGSQPTSKPEPVASCRVVPEHKSGDGILKKASEYRDHAEECRVLAKAALTPEHQAVLENMAETWEMLAKSREHRLQRERRLTDSELLTAQNDD